MSPIFVRPVREQLEHDRLIRHLQAKYKRKYEVGINLGEEQAVPVKIGAHVLFPDMVMSDGRKLAGVVEVETGESVNNLEAMSQWVHFSKARVPFHLYVPVQGYDAARRLCAALNAKVSEIWTYRPDVEGFDLVRMFVEPHARGARETAAQKGTRKATATKGGTTARKKAAGARTGWRRDAGPDRRPTRTDAGPERGQQEQVVRGPAGGNARACVEGRGGPVPTGVPSGGHWFLRFFEKEECGAQEVGVPFIRHTRDRRGYETTYVMHAYRPQAGPQRTRVLYLFRSPSHIKCCRRALDEEAREALEHTHPDVSFDWTVLGRESSTFVRPEPRRERRTRRPQATPAPSPVPVILDDESLLGRVLGAETAARLRARHTDVLERIARRARTPEDRDRLTDRAQRLTPDDWTDEATIRAASAGVETEWEALLAELPPRRRGRRGGRRRAEAPDETGADRVDTASPSVIIEEAGGSDDARFGEGSTTGARRDSGPAGDGSRGGTGTGDVSGDD